MCDQTAAKPDRPDGKSYVDAVTAAGQRSRTLIYFILILTVLTFAAERNSYGPDWAEQRYRTREQIYACYIRNECTADLDERLVKAGLIPKKHSDDQTSEALQICKSELSHMQPGDDQRRKALQCAAIILGID